MVGRPPAVLSNGKLFGLWFCCFVFLVLICLVFFAFFDNFLYLFIKLYFCCLPGLVAALGRLEAGYQVLATNELLALGAANVSGALCGGVPTCLVWGSGNSLAEWGFGGFCMVLLCSLKMFLLDVSVVFG